MGGGWGEALGLAYDRLVMGVLPVALAAGGMLLTVAEAARTSVEGSRAVPELVWALLIIFVLRPGILAGPVALAIHNFGIVGKLAAEVAGNLDPGPTRALEASGAGAGQRMLYGVPPQVLPQLLSCTLYRWEVVMRTTIVVGFVAASGLGREFRLSMSF